MYACMHLYSLEGESDAMEIVWKEMMSARPPLSPAAGRNAMITIMVIIPKLIILVIIITTIILNIH